MRLSIRRRAAVATIVAVAASQVLATTSAWAAPTATTTVAPAAPVTAAALSPIDQRYASDAALRKLLGAPTGAEFSVANGRQRNYKYGSLLWSSSTGVHELHGAILWKFKQLGGAAKLGFPTTDEKTEEWRVPGNVVLAYNRFANGGALMWNTRTTYWIPRAYMEKWHGFIETGRPEQPQLDLGNGRHMWDFGLGRFYSGATTGTHYVGTWIEGNPAVLDKYLAVSDYYGFLGMPTSDRITLLHDADDGFQNSSYQKFVGGNIYYHVTTGEAHEVHGAILSRYNVEGGIAHLGFPITDEQAAAGGRVSYFEHGKIFWSSTTKQTKVTWY